MSTSPLTNAATGEHFSRLAVARGVNEQSNVDKYEVIEGLLLPASTHPEILECGAGAGFYTRRFLQEGYRVTAVELSPEAMAENRKQALAMGKEDSLRMIQGDFLAAIPQIHRRFDQVVFVKVLHHFVSPQTVCEALDGARRICRPGGRTVVFEPNGANRLWSLFLRLQKDPSSNLSKWHYERNMRFTTPRRFRDYLGEADYTLSYHYLIPSFLLQKKRKGATALNAINRALEKTPLRKFAFNISIVIDTPENSHTAEVGHV